MTTQPEALRLADDLQSGHFEMAMFAAEELRRLYQSEREGWRWADELEQERRRLHAVNEELLKALKSVMALPDHLIDVRDEAKAARAAISKAGGEA